MHDYILLYVHVIDFENWAWYRPDGAKMYPEDIDATLCTHIMYGFAVLDASSLLVTPTDTWADFDNGKYIFFRCLFYVSLIKKSVLFPRSIVFHLYRILQAGY